MLLSGNVCLKESQEVPWIPASAVVLPLCTLSWHIIGSMNCIQTKFISFLCLQLAQDPLFLWKYRNINPI